MRQNPGHLKSLRGGGAEIARVSVVEQNDDAKFEGVGDESKVLVVEISGPADAEGVPKPAAPRFLRGAINLLHAERAHDPGFGGHGVPACMSAGQSEIGTGRYHAMRSTRVGSAMQLDNAFPRDSRSRSLRGRVTNQHPDEQRCFPLRLRVASDRLPEQIGTERGITPCIMKMPCGGTCRRFSPVRRRE